MRPRAAVTAMAIGSALAIAGCGLGPGPGTSNVTLTVTRNFGSGRVTQLVERRIPGAETVMRLLERHVSVATRYGGGFVESINGLSGTSAHRDWFYYVNGVEASQGAATTGVHRGDRIWWDLHDWIAPLSSPAVVGSFPEPFLHGVGGKRLPTTIECAADATAACKRVSAELASLGVPAATPADRHGLGHRLARRGRGDVARSARGDPREPDRPWARRQRRVRALRRSGRLLARASEPRRGRSSAPSAQAPGSWPPRPKAQPSPPG